MAIFRAIPPGRYIIGLLMRKSDYAANRGVIDIGSQTVCPRGICGRVMEHRVRPVTLSHGGPFSAEIRCSGRAHVAQYDGGGRFRCVSDECHPSRRSPAPAVWLRRQ